MGLDRHDGPCRDIVPRPDATEQSGASSRLGPVAGCAYRRAGHSPGLIYSIADAREWRIVLRLTAARFGLSRARRKDHGAFTLPRLAWLNDWIPMARRYG